LFSYIKTIFFDSVIILKPEAGGLLGNSRNYGEQILKDQGVGLLQGCLIFF
jgi:hypothetical protein